MRGQRCAVWSPRRPRWMPSPGPSRTRLRCHSSGLSQRARLAASAMFHHSHHCCVVCCCAAVSQHWPRAPSPSSQPSKSSLRSRPARGSTTPSSFHGFGGFCGMLLASLMQHRRHYGGLFGAAAFRPWPGELGGRCGRDRRVAPCFFRSECGCRAVCRMNARRSCEKYSVRYCGCGCACSMRAYASLNACGHVGMRVVCVRDR